MPRGDDRVEGRPSNTPTYWLRRELDSLNARLDAESKSFGEARAVLERGKADKRWVETELGHVKTLANRALEEAGQEYVCVNEVQLINLEKSINEVKERISKWDTWWRAVMITVISGVVLVGGAMLTSLHRVESLEKDVVEIRQDIEKMDRRISKVGKGVSDVGSRVDDLSKKVW